ncbi:MULTISPECIES: mitochondrial fission ELM1 family protein [Jonquetella]|uniref:Putative nucleoside-diphosphate-sugar epimerase n=1 Tax=Jonquetella anthropi DSM 22815 TaxID=885272 RepID=H0UKI8_9BACT|nr:MULTISPECIES: ELM1/GtrOC1 family putative glycosyltransferase [Jonquetella]EEX48388.1 hypothetical protein GCWU000246_01034 [Jonquetella anthropi E3_33 E1]EHM13197.1 putative nucleoside-diphosphate-sugar epimerase [Jonquetella anthropi DSM 22815]ERL23670.1 hypothetical protein HMPREF1249_0653 [Jonquetella sp. BV3C21]
MTGPNLFVLSDGVRGHLSQTRGIALAIGALHGQIDARELPVPTLSGKQRFSCLKVASRVLPKATQKEAENWLREAQGSGLLEQVRTVTAESETPPLFLSAGSGAAPYCLALSKALAGKSCVVMTPSALGTEPFDMAIVPRHDSARGDNVFVTLGAPNLINKEDLVKQAQTLLLSSPLSRQRAWGVLVGGDDRNYQVTPRWAEKFFPQLFDAARRADVDLYVTTSRRTSELAESAIKDQCEAEPRVRMLLLASADERNPVPGMLGFCDKMFCTEDSVSMISECVTAGVPLAVVPVEHRHGPGSVLQRFAEMLSCIGLYPTEKLWGAPRFRRMIDDFAAQGFLRVLYPEEICGQTLADESLRPAGGVDFNEAKKAAAWVLSRWLPSA